MRAPVTTNRAMNVVMAAPNAAPIYNGKYAAELVETATAMVLPGKGLLACDESTGTVGTRLEANGMENTEQNRQIWRNLLFTTEGIGEYISGAILFEETLFQSDPNDKWCTGLDNLSDRCAGYYAQGARFAKWRTALQINVEEGCPTDLAIDVAAQDLARYARICQENGLVPIVEPEILIDGTHDIATTARVQERILSTVYKKLRENGVLLEGSLLKPSMTVPGVECPDKSDPATIAKMTVQTLDRCLPPAMPGVTFLP